jgi:hypothetical protein
MQHYFSHDSNARHHEKLLALRMKHGWAGYGLYWALIEKLRETDDYRLSKNYDLIAFDLRVDSASVESIINDFGLFILEENSFYSESLCKRMAMKESKSEKARKAARIRWDKYNVQNKKKFAPATFSRFVPPTLDEVSNYCNGRQSSVDAAMFIDFYAAKGWMIGKNKMKDWRAAVRTWEKKNKNKESDNDKPATDTRIHPALQS